MRNMSFALTTQQILHRTKTVTRRIGWEYLKPGDLLQAIEKGQGLKAGEKARKLAVIRVKDVRRERLDELLGPNFAYGNEEVVREGFPDATPAGFIYMFVCSHRVPDYADSMGRIHYRRCEASDEVTRVEFEYVDEAPSEQARKREAA